MSSEDDRCGHCDKALKDTDVLMKPCSCCGSDRYLHTKCARKYYSWFHGVPKEYFSADRFQTRLLRFFCVFCQTKVCFFCERHSKKHNVGEPNSFPVVCFDGHWSVATPKCAPQFKGSKLRKWFCRHHANQQKTKAVCGLEEPRGVLKYSLPNELYNLPVQPISRWYSDGTKKEISYLKEKVLSNYVDGGFIKKSLLKFKLLTDYFTVPHPKETKKDKIRNVSNKKFMQDLLCMNKFKSFTDERGNRKSSLHKNILSRESDEIFPVISPRSLNSIINFGEHGLIEDNVFIIFYSLLQELVLLENENSTKKVPNIFMDSIYLERISPPSHIYLNTDINLIFFDDPEVILCENLLASDWYYHSHNRRKYAHEYKHWFENMQKFKYDDVFDKLKELNEVITI